ncbi:hypothetical protein [Rheinheimera sp.]|uniref:hypothetical protein n=1 Tax=Rheinheimera sp. TaxID=1869214 RepID=UPI00307F4C77
MIKTAIAVFIGVFAGGASLLMSYHAYVNYQVRSAINEAEENTARSEAEMAASKRLFAIERAATACAHQLRAHHRADLINLTPVSRTESFSAFNYQVKKQDYHGRCTFDERTNTVNDIHTEKI